MKWRSSVWCYQHAVDCAQDWGIDPEYKYSLEQSQQQSTRIAAVPVMFNEPRDFSYLPGNELIDLSSFDLVLLSDIEYRPRDWVQAWLEKNQVRRWLMLEGSINLGLTPAANIAYRPWWIYNRDIKFNRIQDLNPGEKIFGFDALLGSRRPNRDFLMLWCQTHGLLDHNIVTYRDMFPGTVIDRRNGEVAKMFAEPLQWPYVSDNLKPEWEVSRAIDNRVSQTVPWEIYRRTSFSVACESVCSGDIFFMAEKISKPMMAERPFVVLGIWGFLAQLRKLGYRTFHDYIDESYDTITDDLERWTAACEQINWLNSRPPQEIYDQCRSAAKHNRQHILECGSRARLAIEDLLRSQAADVID